MNFKLLTQPITSPNFGALGSTLFQNWIANCQQLHAPHRQDVEGVGIVTIRCSFTSIVILLLPKTESGFKCWLHSTEIGFLALQIPRYRIVSQYMRNWKYDCSFFLLPLPFFLYFHFLQMLTVFKMTLHVKRQFSEMFLEYP